MSEMDLPEEDAMAVAIIGMDGRFPGASSLTDFWDVIRSGRDTISRFSEEEFPQSRPCSTSPRDESTYVRARGILDDVDLFDAKFFGYTPREAAALDPQQRVWLEVVWGALEGAGYAHDAHGKSIGVYAGSFANHYLLHNLLQDRRAVEEYVRMQGASSFEQLIANDGAFLPSRTSYKLNLRGPAVNVQTACSTSLVAVSMAVQSLLTYEADICIAGGICIALPQESGYFAEEGAISSTDGYCRPYDAAACGTVLGSGAGAVILRRLSEAEEDGDRILAVIRGAAINNDGSCKVSYTAPSVEGQAEVIAASQAMADVEVESIGYVEGHGTATPMGDPIEFAALTKAFRSQTDAKNFCGLGSVKANIGHLDAAAGIAGLIKAVLILQHRYIPPTAHFESANPELAIDDSPFYIPRQGKHWDADGSVRRAAVSSFGIGGTNAHVILEEAPQEACREQVGEGTQKYFVPISAPCASGLDASTARLADWLEGRAAPERAGGEDGGVPVPLGSIASTLFRRRKAFERRRLVIGDSRDAWVSALRDRDRWISGKTLDGSPDVVFMFPGQGTLVAGATAELIQSEPLLERHLRECCEVASPRIELDLMAWFRDSTADIGLMRSDNAKLQLAILCLEVAMVRWLQHWGIQPKAMLGHSLGEWTAAHVAGVFRFEDAVAAVFERGRLMQLAPRGAAIGVRAGPDELSPYLSETVHLAARNGPMSSLLSGTEEAIWQCADELKAAGIRFRMQNIDVPVHSPFVDDLVAPLQEVLSRLQLSPASIPVCSTATGGWLEESQATSPEYWAMHMRLPVRFSDALAHVTRKGSSVLLEVGHGTGLANLSNPQIEDRRRHRAIALLPLVDESGADRHCELLSGIGKLWIAGCAVDLDQWNGAGPHTVQSLPTYPFQRDRHWVSAPEPDGSRAEQEASRPLVRELEATEDGDLDSSCLVEQVTVLLAERSGHEPSELDASTPFFELGMDSLFLVGFTDAINQRYGTSIRFRDLSVRHNTIALLASFLTEARSQRATETERSIDASSRPWRGDEPFVGLTPIQPGGAKTPLVLIHGDRAEAMLVDYLSKDHPYYGYQHQGSDGERMQHKTIPDLASRFVFELRQELPHGPYVLGGHSYGGLVAYHAAHLLEEAGEEVRLLMLIDAVNPAYEFEQMCPDRSRRIRGRIRKQRKYLRALRDIVAAEFRLLTGRPVAPENRRSYISATYQRAWQRYDPPRIETPTVLMRASDNDHGDHYKGWRDRVETIECVEFEGSHLSIVRSEEHFAPLGQEIAKRLSELS